MQIVLPGGYTFFLGNLLSFLVIMPVLIWACLCINKKVFDKPLHMLVCGAGTFGLLHLFIFIRWGWWLAPMTIMLVGFTKEFLDLFNPKKKLFDWMDILADVAGCGSITLAYISSFLL